MDFGHKQTNKQAFQTRRLLDGRVRPKSDQNPAESTLLIAPQVYGTPVFTRVWHTCVPISNMFIHLAALFVVVSSTFVDLTEHISKKPSWCWNSRSYFLLV